eukprot:Gb_27736 [translate_table: standard]
MLGGSAPEPPTGGPGSPPATPLPRPGNERPPGRKLVGLDCCMQHRHTPHFWRTRHSTYQRWGDCSWSLSNPFGGLLTESKQSKRGTHTGSCHLYGVGWLSDEFTNNCDVGMNATALSTSNNAPTLESILYILCYPKAPKTKSPLMGGAIGSIGGVECHAPFMYQAPLLSNGGYVTSTSNIIEEMRVSAPQTRSPYKVIQPSPIKPRISSEDFIQLCIGSFTVVGDSVEMPLPLATITASIETLDASPSVDVM